MLIWSFHLRKQKSYLQGKHDDSTCPAKRNKTHSSAGNQIKVSSWVTVHQKQLQNKHIWDAMLLWHRGVYWPSQLFHNNILITQPPFLITLIWWLHTYSVVQGLPSAVDSYSTHQEIPCRYGTWRLITTTTRKTCHWTPCKTSSI
jgi:hypothetical protein